MSQRQFASFLLGNVELGLPLESVQEVVDMSSQLSPITGAPEFLLGALNLRGVAIPLLDTSLVLNIPRSETQEHRKVAVLVFEKKLVGLIFDRTSEIISSSGDEYRQKEELAVADTILGLLNLDQGQRLVEVLHPLAFFEKVKSFEIPQKVMKQTEQQREERQQIVTFSMGFSKFGLPLTDIQEIISLPEIKRSVLAGDECLGLINLRGGIIPLLNFYYFLQLQTPKFEKETQRVLVLTRDKKRVAIVVDSVESITSFASSEVLPVPSGSLGQVVFSGLLKIDNEDQLLKISPQDFFSDSRVQALIVGHEKLYGPSSQAEESRKASFQREFYLSFRLGATLSTRLKCVEEVAAPSEKLLEPPGSLPYVVGLLPQRGEVVTVIDLRKFYGLPQTQSPAESRILIVKGQNSKLGLLVDSVEAIYTVDDSKKISIPLMLARDVSKGFQGDLNEILEMPDLNGNKSVHMILNIPGLVERIEAQHQRQGPKIADAA